MGNTGVFIALGLGVLVVGVLFLPQLRQWWMQTWADEVTITRSLSRGTDGVPEVQTLKIVSVLGKDGIPAILKPVLVSADAAAEQMMPNERVLGLSINGDHRAYSLNLLSRHEIVNDTVGGKPVAVTW